MRIGFVAEPYEESHASGMGYVVLELMRQLAMDAGGNELVVFSSKPIDKTLVPGVHENVLVPASFIGKLFWFCKPKTSVDVLLYQVPLLPLIVPRRIKSVAMCQELGSQKTQVHGFRERALALVRDQILMPISLKRAAHITAASQATKNDLLKFYRLHDRDVVVIHDGFQDLSNVASNDLVVESRMRPYFFFAGKVKPRKNVHGIVSGFIEFKKRTGADCKLVIGGDYGGAYYQNMVDNLRRSGLESEVFFPGYVTGASLVSFYKNAIAFVFPSFNEGFGMPPLEAMSLGTPVITSNMSSMPEVVGDAALLVDPYSAQSISGAMEKIYTDKVLRAQLVEKGLERCTQFSWQKAGQEYVALINAL
jgi:glycosyltransferase involved in cell wall biosynthesis